MSESLDSATFAVVDASTFDICIDPRPREIPYRRVLLMSPRFVKYEHVCVYARVHAYTKLLRTLTYCIRYAGRNRRQFSFIDLVLRDKPHSYANAFHHHFSKFSFCP